MANRCCLCLSALLLLVAPAGIWAADAPPAAPAADAAAILKVFFAEDDAAKRADLAAKFAAVAPKSWTDLKTMLHAASQRPPIAAGRSKFQTQGDGAVPSVRYVLRVPAGYAADAGKGWPLVVACHGSGSGADACISMVEGLLGPDVEQYLVASPDAPDPKPYEANRMNQEYPLHVLWDVRQRANVDSDRTVLTGVSRGGYTTWGTVLFSPGEWAGAIPIASFPLTEARAEGAILYLPNAMNVGIQAHWGAGDIEPGQKEGISTLSRDVAAEFKRLGAKKFEGIEYPGEGHGLKVKADKVRAFLAAARRDPFPTECRLIFHRLDQGRDYYVRATAAARPEFDFRAKHVVTVTRKEDLRPAERALYLREGYELTARMPAGQNLVAVLAKNLKEVEVELAAEKIDFARPIRITVGGRTVQEGPRKFDWAELLETARRTGDFERLIAGRIKVPVAGK